jgi:hypothetical protein
MEGWAATAGQAETRLRQRPPNDLFAPIDLAQECILYRASEQHRPPELSTGIGLGFRGLSRRYLLPRLPIGCRVGAPSRHRTGCQTDG